MYIHPILLIGQERRDSGWVLPGPGDGSTMRLLGWFPGCAEWELGKASSGSEFSSGAPHVTGNF